MKRLLLCLFTTLWSVSTQSTEIFNNNNNNRDNKDKWKFLHAYPKHVVVRRVREGEIAIDGVLNESVWSELAEWQDNDFEDIRLHLNQTDLNNIPFYQQASVAVLYDSQYLYIGATLKEPFTFGTIPCSHNGDRVPYRDNDFEFFVDPSGSTEYYKEFEMNALNATYDVNWGVPDQAGLRCANNATTFLPMCTNTSSPFYYGSWTMFDNTTERNGLQSATTSSNFGVLDTKNGKWSLEIAFPLRNGSNHGGLLDSEDKLISSDRFYDFSRFDPSLYDLSERSMYWSADFARTVHPRKYYHNSSETAFMWCPLSKNCSISNAKSASTASPNAEECTELSKEDLSMLGSDPNYACYFEWVYMNLGPDNAYMHRPLSWSFLEFTERKYMCGNIQFPVRHLLRILYLAEKNYFASTNSYTSNVSELISYCDVDQDKADLRYAQHSNMFDVHLNVENEPIDLNTTCTSRPCYKASIYFTSPHPPRVLLGHVNENMRVWFENDILFNDCLF